LPIDRSIGPEEGDAVVVDYEYADGVARVHLDRPERLNAVVPELTEGLIAAIDRAGAEGARVVILAGRGRAFCAGHDLKEPVPVETLTQTRLRLERLQEVTRAIRRCPGVVIAAVHGYALGAGCEFALGCDLVVADESTQFGFPEVSVGLSVTGGISRLLVDLIGLRRAKELLLLGERVTAAQALELGLINRVCAPGEHEPMAQQLAQVLIDRPALAVSLAKRTIDLGAESTLEQALALEVDQAILTSLSGEGTPAQEAFARG
jgi:2-(1,2-epoxy-1,2-dihydrophenyl)acetyl-CoA isomerase